MVGKIMYCAIPSRIRHLTVQVEEIARQNGYAPIIPFNVGRFEDLEGNPDIGRDAALDYMLYVQRYGGFRSKDKIVESATGIFGISEGVIGEFEQALNIGQEIRVFPDLDAEWDKYYQHFLPKSDELFNRLRGPNHLIALVGPSAIGKTALSNHALRHFARGLQRVKNTTTRPPRDAVDHESYNFISREEFEAGIKQRRFYEHDIYLGHCYGSSMADIKEALKRKSGIFAITPAGAEKLWRYRWEVNVTFVLLVSVSAVLETHCQRRGITDPHKLSELLAAAKNFQLPAHLEHLTMTVTEDTEENQNNFLDLVAPLIHQV